MKSLVRSLDQWKSFLPSALGRDQDIRVCGGVCCDTVPLCMAGSIRGSRREKRGATDVVVGRRRLFTDDWAVGNLAQNREVTRAAGPRKCSMQPQQHSGKSSRQWRHLLEFCMVCDSFWWFGFLRYVKNFNEVTVLQWLIQRQLFRPDRRSYS